MTVPTYPRETVDVAGIEVSFNGVVITTGYQLALTQGMDRPATWAAPVTAPGGETGVEISGLAPGLYRVWAKQTNAAPYAPVAQVGYIRIT